MPAALVMASIHSILRAEAPRLVAPAAVLERANQLLVAETPVSMFVTCVYAVLDPASGRLRWANAGHDLPLLRTAPGVAALRATGMPLGMLPGSSYEEKSTEVPPGGVLLFNSDGITEAHGPGREMFGSARLAELAARRLDGAALIRLVLDELDQFTGPHWEQEDDITLVALERAAADPAVPRPVELGRPATAAAAIPLVAGGAGPAGPARRVLVEERPTRRTAGERPRRS